MNEATRKLATIVALDVAGYSARTERDETATTSEVAALRQLIEGIAQARGGRIFNTAGDGFMLEFSSSLAAVEAAHDLAAKCEPKVRVGVHLGDVVVQPNGDLLGHGVNVAARLMARSEPGSTLISGDVRRTIRGPWADRLVSCGLLKLDKMTETIEAFALAAVASAIVEIPPKVAEPLLAVLPFDNLSNDPEMQFFSDGVSEEILQRLMRGANLKVIGRASSFQFRGDKKSDAARILKCTHVLDGSIRRAGGRVRVAAQLVDAASHTMLWSDRYDRGLEDIFAVQDEISESIASALNRSFSIAAIVAIDPKTYDLYLRGSAPGFSPEQLLSKVDLLEEVTKRAPKFANGWGRLAEWRSYWMCYQPYTQRRAIAKLISTEAELALSLDPQNFYARIAEFLVLPPFGKFIENAIIADHLRQDAHGAGYCTFFDISCVSLRALGRVREAIAVSEHIIEHDALNPASVHMRGACLWAGGRNAEARQSFESVLRQWPDYIYSAIDLIMMAAFAGDWATVDSLLAPERLAKFPLGHVADTATSLVSALRDPSPISRRRPIEAARQYFERTGRAEINSLAFAAQLGFVDEVYEIATRATFGPAGDGHDVMGPNAYRTQFLFHAHYTEIRSDPRFVKLCASLGLVEYWLTTQRWPDCADEVPYDFKAACEEVRNIPKQEFGF